MFAPQEHEYAVMGGYERAKVGRYLTLAASSISALLVIGVLAAVNLAKSFALNTNVPPVVMSLLSASGVFAGLYWLLNKYAWKWPWINGFLKIPNLAGAWDCQGQSLNPDGTVAHQWSGEVTIVQKWDKLRIRLKTSQSGSNSVAAALAADSIDGFVLLYQYRNDPKIGEPELATHSGCALVTFASDLSSATAEYFNGRGRSTFGTMTWTKRQ